jgi:hypothetical protein
MNNSCLFNIIENLDYSIEQNNLRNILELILAFTALLCCILFKFFKNEICKKNQLSTNDSEQDVEGEPHPKNAMGHLQNRISMILKDISLNNYQKIQAHYLMPHKFLSLKGRLPSQKTDSSETRNLLEPNLPSIKQQLFILKIY